MEETTPPERDSSGLVVGFKHLALLVKGGECGELVLPSLPLVVRRTEESADLVCGRVRALTGNRENNPVPAVSVWSEEEGQGGGGGGPGSAACLSMQTTVSALSLTWRWTRKRNQRQ